jgi:chlorite dismutase
MAGGLLPWRGMANQFYSFIGGSTGPWSITEVRAVTGRSIEPAPRLEILNTLLDKPPPNALWLWRGVTSNQRYTARAEQNALAAVQEYPGRPEATCAALIPITRSAAWWALTQDERRAIFEDRSAHIATGLRYLPAIARRLHHCRDLGEPFDFLTWFEFAPQHTAAFDDLVGALRQTEEWSYVEREVDIRLVREDHHS